ncbi:hypothetical protein FF100_35140 [Methylobacterium terricola]|uniref:Uncharacterized protein n=1 Tax=Methylobacterium terricola TaxID=2583531 RepID=A0A5C4L7N9_9HYPH|nr:hypothetical protein [Methylobacterium terricola]TNC05957.1 hypothetical protein FF100_35140 [Methylobacterium terricola]
MSDLVLASNADAVVTTGAALRPFEQQVETDELDFAQLDRVDGGVKVADVMRCFEWLLKAGRP